MANLAAAGAAYLTREVVDQDLCDAVFQKFHFLRAVATPVSQNGGDSVIVKCKTSENATAAAYSEGDSALTPGAPTVLDATFSFRSWWVYFGVTGHAARELGSNQAGTYWPGVDINQEDALKDLRDIIETDTAANATYGIIGQVDDDTTTYGALNRGTYTALKSYVKAAGAAALTTATLEEALFATIESPYGGNPELIISAPVQMRKYVSQATVTPQAGGAGIDLGFGLASTFAGLPWIAVPGFTTSVVLLLTGVSEGGILYVDHTAGDIADVVMPMVADPSGFSPGLVSFLKQGVSGDAVTYAAKHEGALIVRKPMLQGKIENLATS